MLPTGNYRHYKGKDYEVVGVATHSETREPYVVYRLACRRLKSDLGERRQVRATELPAT